jgi:hypothetical protein
VIRRSDHVIAVLIVFTNLLKPEITHGVLLPGAGRMLMSGVCRVPDLFWCPAFAAMHAARRHRPLRVAHK